MNNTEHKKTFLQQVYDLNKNDYQLFWDAYRNMQPGRDRREALLRLIPRQFCGGITVNKKHSANLKDPDLQYLLKRGKLIRKREAGYSLCRGNYCVTRLYVAPVR